MKKKKNFKFCKNENKTKKKLQPSQKKNLKARINICRFLDNAQKTNKKIDK